MITGCETQRESMIKEGYPLAYANGFDDGCHSGNKAGGSLFDQFKKDVRLFGSDKKYSQGWSDGYRQCETEQEALQRQIRMGMEQQHYNNQKKHNDWEEKNHLNSQMFDGINYDPNLLNKLK